MPLMFIFMPPGIMMSPGLWSDLWQLPSHFASMVEVVSSRRRRRRRARERASSIPTV